MNELETSKPTLGQKLKSWKRWMAIFGMAAPLVTKMMGGEITIFEALIAFVMAALVGMGILAYEDVKRFQAAATLALAKSTNGTKPAP